MHGVLDGIRGQLHWDGHWMAWNLMLALVPWALAFVLFRPRRRLGLGWWLGVAACIALLPNAAYVLTDVIHLPGAVRRQPSDSVVLTAVLPLFVALFVIGFTAYSDALRRMSAFAVGRGWLAKRWPLETAVHAVTAVAIYAGRVHRFNSWDVVFRPGLLADRMVDSFTKPFAAAAMLFVFVSLVVGYAVMRTLLDSISPVRGLRRVA